MPPGAGLSAISPLKITLGKKKDSLQKEPRKDWRGERGMQGKKTSLLSCFPGRQLTFYSE
jgi:hypothetical protein